MTTALRLAVVSGIFVFSAIACAVPSDGDPTSGGDDPPAVSGLAVNVPQVPKTKSIAPPTGVYVPTFNQPIVGPKGNAKLQALLTNPNVDGFFVARAWNDVETTKGSIDFSSMIADLRAIAQAGKKASIGIGAGINSPDYVCQSKASGGAGAQCLALVIHPPQETGACINETLPVPWNAAFQAAFAKVVTALAAAVAKDSVAASAIVDVKITGFNDRNLETILPSATGGTMPCTTGDACMNGVCHESDAVSALVTAGYSDASASTAIVAFAHMFRAAFPNVSVGAQVSPGLPRIKADDVHLAMDDALVGDRTLVPLTAQNQGLAGIETEERGLDDALAAHDPIGFQMLAYVADNPKCLMGHGLGPGGGDAPCTEAVLRSAVDHGIAMGASWLEIYEEDVVAYPSTIAYAHRKLTP